MHDLYKRLNLCYANHLDGGCATRQVRAHPNGCGPEGWYNLSDDGKSLQIRFHEGTGFNAVGPFGLWAFTPKWKITKLTSAELWLEVNFNNMFCTLHLGKL